MSPALAPIAPRLGQLMLLLSSNHDGEVVAAARAIGRTLKSHRLDWHDLAEALCPPLVPVGRPINDRDWRDLLAFCATRMHRLSSRECDFLRLIARRRSDLTPRQRDWLEIIAEKLRGVAA
jgi:hypothetical protein